MAPPRESARSRTFFAVAISASISSVERLRASSIFGRAMLAAHARAVVARAVPTKIRRPLAVARSAKRKRKSFMAVKGSPSLSTRFPIFDLARTSRPAARGHLRNPRAKAPHNRRGLAMLFDVFEGWAPCWAPKRRTRKK